MMKHSLFIVFTIIYFQSSFAQAGFKVCDSESIYTIEDPKLEIYYKEKKHKVASQYPKFKGGKAEVEKYFVKNVTLDSGEQNQLIKRIVIGFTVDCNGNPGNSWIMSKEQSELVIKVQNLVESMPKWEPAVHKKKNVDCNTRLIISVSGSQILVKYKE